MAESEVITTLLQLFSNYFKFAWLFCLLHTIVAGLFFLHIKTILQEGDALRRWISGTHEPQNDCARVLQQFVDESRYWGPRGTFVPMTDFSDRLDSFVGGRLDTLHNLVRPVTASAANLNMAKNVPATPITRNRLTKLWSVSRRPPTNESSRSEKSVIGTKVPRGPQ